tara:strand:+ start:1157 stop:1372 length:216 start_codon:yes stop_codon:yes gene_type:complete
MDMKLSKFLYSKLTEGDGEPVFSVDTLDEWIAEWYQEIYDRAPPVWLSGPRWYDRRKRKIQEAKELEEQKG